MNRRAFPLLAALACGSPPEARESPSAVARAEGVWRATFTLDRSPAPASAVRNADVHGTVALLAHSGTYDIDFTPFGFDPRDAGTARALVADTVPGDSISLELADARRGTVVVLRGRLAGDSISGTWTVYIARDAGGRGRFVMKRKP